LLADILLDGFGDTGIGGEGGEGIAGGEGDDGEEDDGEESVIDGKLDRSAERAY